MTVTLPKGEDEKEGWISQLTVLWLVLVGVMWGMTDLWSPGPLIANLIFTHLYRGCPKLQFVFRT